MARRYKEAIDLEGVLAAGGAKKLRKGAVASAWRKCLEQSTATGDLQSAAAVALRAAATGGGGSGDDVDEVEAEEAAVEGAEEMADEGAVAPVASGRKRARGQPGATPAPRTRGKGKKKASVAAAEASIVDVDTADAAVSEADLFGSDEEDTAETSNAKGLDAGEATDGYTPTNLVKRNRGDPISVRAAKLAARDGKASSTILKWLFPPPESRTKTAPRKKFGEFSETKPPLVMDGPTIQKAIAHLSARDPKMESLIARVGKDALCQNIGAVLPPTRERFFDKVLKGITFSQISVRLRMYTCPPRCRCMPLRGRAGG